MGNFQFLLPEFSAVFESASKAEALAIPDPRTSCFYARRALELAVSWAYKFDSGLKLPYQDNISALIHEPTFKQIAGDAVFNKAKVIVTLGNRAVHHHRPIPESDSTVAVKELFHVCYWLVHSYARQNRPQSGLKFEAATLPRATPIPRQTLEQLQELSAELREKDEKLSKLLADKSSLDEELKQLRAEVAAARKEVSSKPDSHDYSEAETRDYFIDLLLKEAGWPLDQARDREFEVTGMPNNLGLGYVDYVLWGDDGKPLAVVEAKRTKHDARIGQHQAKLYADCLKDVRATACDLLFQRLRTLDLGRCELSATASAGVLQKGRAGTADSAPDDSPIAAGGHSQHRDCGTRLPNSGDSTHLRSL